MVQVLKEELRQAIVRHAQDEFAQHGYANASIKRIAANAGISVGNLYRYFPGKEALFETVVSPVQHELETLIYNHEKYAYDEHTGIFELVVQALTAVVGEYRVPLLILIDGSKGTRFETPPRIFTRRWQRTSRIIWQPITASRVRQRSICRRLGRSRSLLCRDTSKSSAATGIRKTANKWFANMSLFGIKACGRFCEKGARVFLGFNNES
ncbi:Nucleoid occlusion factor SlmA [Paenibacillus sp. P1XP2]|nr:Nucleoid occlusion factor SlmA [Paenibacillus sp. P1XP2]